MLMNIPKDLHICGICKKIFNDIKLFLDHKSKCFIPQSSISLTQDISLDSGLFSSQTVLDLTVLESDPFPLVLQYDNEEVVSDNDHLQLQEGNSAQDQLNQTLTTNNIINDVEQEDIATLLVTELSKEVLNKSPVLKRSQEADRRITQVPKGIQLGKYQTVDQKPIEEVLEETSLKQKQINACNVCNYVAVHQRDLQRHMGKHSGRRPFMCNFCDKTFSRQDRLVTHRRIHLGDKRFKCQLCEYATTDSGTLRKHIRIHTDERPYKCQMCSYRARNASHLIVHLRTHTGDCPFFCQFETCERVFKTSTDLQRHMKVHKLDNMSPTYSSFGDMTGKYPCKNLCKGGNLFNKPSSCNICQDFTPKEISKKKGSRKKGGRAMCVKAHQCPHCNAAFVRQDSLRSHMRQHPQSTAPLLDNDELEKENDSASLSDTADKRTSVGNTDCLQDSCITLDSDSPVHYTMDNNFL